MNIPSSDPVVLLDPEGVDGNIHTNGLGLKRGAGGVFVAPKTSLK